MLCAGSATSFLLVLRLSALPLIDLISAATLLGFDPAGLAVLLRLLGPTGVLPPSLLLLQLPTAVIVGAVGSLLVSSCFCRSSAMWLCPVWNLQVEKGQ